MTTHAEFVDLHRRSWGRFEALCTGLSSDQWATQSLCPDWDIAGVVTHVGGIEKVLTEWSPSTDSPPPFEVMGEFVAEVSTLTGEQLLARCSEVVEARISHLESLDPSEIDKPSITPTGVGTYADFLRIRIFDLWIHERDIADPLGMQTLDLGPDAELTLEEVGGALGYVVGKKVGLPDGMGITFHIVGKHTGESVVDFHAKVDGRASRVESLDDPDVEITADVATFIQLAAGRVDPQERIDAGRITWTGNAEWGEKAARNLRYTR